MQNPFKLLRKASRARRPRPLSAARILQNLLLAPPSKCAGKVKSRKVPAAGNTGVKKPSRTPVRQVVPLPLQGFNDGHYEGLAYKLYVPARPVRRHLPLVVMLHGCRQSAKDFATGTRMNSLADEMGFIVLYPAQSRVANAFGCWNWHRPSDQRRGGGEAGALAALTRWIIRLAKVNPVRVYVAGLSAGGAAAANLAAAYPDIFAAVGVHSGIAPGHVCSLREGLMAMRKGIEAPGETERAQAVPTIAFQGARDKVVDPSNIQGFASNLQHAGPDQSTARVYKEFGVTRTDWRVRRGPTVLEQWLIHDGGHGWSGGDPSGSFTDPEGPDASREMLRFFLARKRPTAGS